MRERAFDNKLQNRHDSKHQYQCSLCQFRSNHPRFIEQHVERKHSKPLQIVSFYRRPSTKILNFVSDFNEFLCNINYRNIPFLFLGDINHDYSSINKSKDPIIQMFNSFGFSVIKTQPTRISSVKTRID